MSRTKRTARSARRSREDIRLGLEEIHLMSADMEEDARHRDECEQEWWQQERERELEEEWEEYDLACVDHEYDRYDDDWNDDIWD